MIRKENKGVADEMAKKMAEYIDCVLDTREILMCDFDEVEVIATAVAEVCYLRYSNKRYFRIIKAKLLGVLYYLLEAGEEPLPKDYDKLSI